MSDVVDFVISPTSVDIIAGQAGPPGPPGADGSGGGAVGQARSLVFPVTFETADLLSGIDSGIVIPANGGLTLDTGFVITEPWTLDDVGYVLPGLGAQASDIPDGAAQLRTSMTDEAAASPLFGGLAAVNPNVLGALTYPNAPLFALADTPIWYGVRVASDTPPVPSLTGGAGLFVISWLDSP